jgi:hypothetical protein
MKLYLTVTLVGLFGCGGLGPGREYRVQVDPSLPPIFTQAVIDSASEWAQAVGQDLRLTVVVSGGTCDDKQHTICVHGSDYAFTQGLTGPGSIGSTTYHGATDSADTWLALDWLDTHSGDINATVRHEMGHAFALQHSGPDTAMCYKMTCASDHVTCDDVGQYRYVRGLGFSSCP